jgi:hypothetical protein
MLLAMSTASTSLCCVGPTIQRRNRTDGAYVTRCTARPDIDSTSENEIQLSGPQHTAALPLTPSPGMPRVFSYTVMLSKVHRSSRYIFHGAKGQPSLTSISLFPQKASLLYPKTRWHLRAHPSWTHLTKLLLESN